MSPTSQDPTPQEKPVLLPAIDLRHGQVVRLQQGDDAQRTTYQRDPEALLEHFAEAGATWAHVVDLDAAFGETPQRRLIEKLVRDAPVKLELGGGLRDEDAVAWALGIGLERVILGSMAARDTDRFLALVERFPGRLAPAVETAGGALKIAGWTESVALSLEDLCARLRGSACAAALVTDVDRDGMMGGPNLELCARVAELSGLPVIVSGGVRHAADVGEAARVPGVSGVIVGKAFYDGRLTLNDALAALGGSADP